MATYPSNFIGPIPNGSIRGKNLMYPSNFIGPIPNGGVRASTPNFGDVLGATTSTYSPKSQTNTSVQQPQTQQVTQPSQPSQPDYQKMIDELYNTGNQVIGDQEAALKQGYSQDESNLNQQFENAANQINDQNTELLDTVSDEERKNKNAIQTALNQAITAFNALKQQRMARFGLGSSAGQAVGELANQEFLRQQGAINQKDAENNLAFAKERTRIGTFIKSKLDDLDLQKNQLLSQLKQNLSDKLNEIASKRYDLAQNRTQDKLNIMQQAASQAQQIADADRQFRQQLGLAAISKMQEISGRAFSPAEITTVLSQFGINMPEITSTASNITPTYYKNVRSPEDELAALNPISVG